MGFCPAKRLLHYFALLPHPTPMVAGCVSYIAKDKPDEIVYTLHCFASSVRSPN